MKPSVTQGENTPTSPPKYPTSLRNRCLCLVLFSKANKYFFLKKARQIWHKNEIFLQQPYKSSWDTAAVKAFSTAVLHIIELKASTKYTLMSAWLLNGYCETRRQNSDFIYIAAASLIWEKTVESPWSSILWNLCSQRKLLSQGTGTAFFVDTCACLKALCISMVLYQRENSCHGHCSNLDTSSDRLVKNSNTTVTI